jgi:hypothetical protein
LQDGSIKVNSVDAFIHRVNNGLFLLLSEENIGIVAGILPPNAQMVTNHISV